MFQWVKAFHVIFMVGWLAGLLYLPRLFMVHTQIDGDAMRARFSDMERRLSIVTSVSAVGTIAAGIWLLVMLGSGWMARNGWIHAKLALVVLLFVYHGWCQMEIKKLRENRARASAGFYRLMPAVPAILLVLIVILAIVQPF